MKAENQTKIAGLGIYMSPIPAIILFLLIIVVEPCKIRMILTLASVC